MNAMLEEAEDYEAGGLPEFVWDPAGVVRRRWPWMLVVLLGALGVALWSVFFLLKPRYVAETTVLVASQRISEDFVRPTVKEDWFEKINAMVGETLLRAQLAELIQKHDLYPELRASSTINEAVARMREDTHIEVGEGFRAPTRYASAHFFSIAFEADHPTTAAEVANDLAELFVAAGIRMRSQQAQLTTRFLSRELERAERALREQNRKITEFKELHRGELPADLEPNLRRLERLQQQSQSLALQLAEAENRMAMLAASDDSSSPDARLSKLRADLAQERGAHTERHPNVVTLRGQIDALRAEIERPLRGDPGGQSSRTMLLAASRRTVEEFERQLAAAQEALRELETRVEQIPATQEILAALEERESVLRDNYMEFLRKVQDAELSQSLESAQQGQRISILERAEPPTHPIRRRWTSLLIGVVACFAGSFGVGWFLEFLDPVLLTTEQVESESGLPVLGFVPRIP